MRKPFVTVLACLGVGSVVSACATAHQAGDVAAEGVKGGAHVASAGAAMVRTTVNETYNGLGGAMRSPLRDLNMMQEEVPASLQKARDSVYDTEGLTSCEVIAAQIQALDVELGPDVDTPRVENQRTRSQRLASAAADGAVNAARGALDHYIPVRGVVRQLSGARKYEKETARALLAGNVRRGFLKAIGMQQNCAWPAAPISFKPAPAAPRVQLAAAQAAPAADVSTIKVVSLARASVADRPSGVELSAAQPAPSAAPAVASVPAPPPSQAADKAVQTARRAEAEPAAAPASEAPALLAAKAPEGAPAAATPVADPAPAASPTNSALSFAGGGGRQPAAVPGLR